VKREAGLANAAGVTADVDVTAASVNIMVTLTIPDGSTDGAGSEVNASSTLVALNATMGTAAQASTLLNITVLSVNFLQVFSNQAPGGGGDNDGSKDTFLLGLDMITFFAIFIGGLAALLLCIIAVACYRNRHQALKMQGSFKPDGRPRTFAPRAWRRAATGHWGELVSLSGGPSVDLCAPEITVGREQVPDCKKGVSKRHAHRMLCEARFERW